MIGILHRYIAKTVIISTALVILVVLGLNFFIGLLTELRNIGVGDYGFAQAVLHVLLMMPHHFYQFFPMIVLLGGMMGLGLLSANQELIVMRASGVSIPRIMSAVITAALILVFFAALIGEGIAPRASFFADKLKDSQQNSGQAVATASGVWMHEGNNFLHINRMIGRFHLEGVTRYQFDAEHHLLAAYYAKALDFQNGQWILHDLVKTTFEKEKTISVVLPETTWDVTLHPEHLSVGLIEPNEMSLSMLIDYSRYLTKNGLQASTFQFEFWKRIFQPLTTLVMVLLAIPFVFGAPRSMVIGKRLLLGVIVGFVFYIFNAFLGQVSVVYQLSPMIAALLPTLIFAVMGYFFMMRTMRV